MIWHCVSGYTAEHRCSYWDYGWQVWFAWCCFAEVQKCREPVVTQISWCWALGELVWNKYIFVFTEVARKCRFTVGVRHILNCFENCWSYFSQFENKTKIVVCEIWGDGKWGGGHPYKLLIPQLRFVGSVEAATWGESVNSDGNCFDLHERCLCTCYVQDSITLLLCDCRETDRVMLCILPESKTQDVSIRIQHTLIEAFCRENDVRVLKVSL